MSPSIIHHKQCPSRPSSPKKPLNLMKLRVLTWSMSSNSNPYWPLSSYTLYSPRRSSIFFHLPSHTRCKLRMTTPHTPRKWWFLIFYLPLSSYRPRHLLWFLFHSWNMKHWSNSFNSSYINRLSRLCSPLRTNKILRRNRNHKFTLSHSLHW